LLVSGSDDKIVKLWDVQTGGIVQDFSGHNHYVLSVSISADSAIIASGSCDESIRLWDISTGECHNVIEQDESVWQVSFSPMGSKQLVARLYNGTVSCWDVNGCQIGPTYNGSYIGISLDGKQFALCDKSAIIVQTFETSATVAEFHVNSGTPCHCCFSPDGKLIAAAVGETAYVWDISSSDSQPIKTFIGHTSGITALVFYSPSSLISASYDASVKFWQIGTLSTDPVETNLSPTPTPSHEVVSTTLQAKDGVVITSDSDGTVRVLDVLTGLCKASFQTPATGSKHRDGQFINGRLIFAWSVQKTIHIYGTSEEELILAPRESKSEIEGLKIGGDGSTIFCLGERYIQAWSIMTGEVLGEVEIEYSKYKRNLVVDGLRVWAFNSDAKDQRWDFGIPGSSPTQLPNIPPSKLHPNGSMLWDLDQSKVQDVVTGRVVFQLPKTFGKPIDVQWNDQHLVICFGPTKVLILDFSYFLAQ
jgi:WD40 repeat protein